MIEAAAPLDSVEGSLQTTPGSTVEVSSLPSECDAIDYLAEGTPRHQEELQVLMMGFATGMLIAAVFIVYIVLSFAHWL